MKYAAVALAIVAMNLGSTAVSQEPSERDANPYRRAGDLSGVGTQAWRGWPARQGQDWRGNRVPLWQGMPARQGEPSALGDDSRQLCQSSADLPRHEARASEKPQVDDCRRADCLCLLPTMHDEDRRRSKVVSSADRPAVPGVAQSPELQPISKDRGLREGEAPAEP